MTQPLRTLVPFRHDRLSPPDREESRLAIHLRTSVHVRPARQVFQHDPKPRTAKIVEWIRKNDPLRKQEGDEDWKRPPYAPFVYRGEVAAHPEDGHPVEVHLWEEPSGRPLNAPLPLAWFESISPYKGMPFKLVTWMVEHETEAPIARHRLQALGTNIYRGSKR